MTYNWQQKDWPNFRYNLSSTMEDALYVIAEKMGQVNGMLLGLPENVQSEALIDIMVAEAMKTSEIEGEYLSRKDVMSSVRNNLGLNEGTEHVSDKRAQGIAELMGDVRRNFQKELTAADLFSWHTMLMKGARRIKIGEWRDHEEPMQVISEPMGKEKIHYEAPPSERVAAEMNTLIAWFNNTAPSGQIPIRKGPIRSAITHLYFETIHPFEDGNGRIGRALSEKALSQGIGRPVLLSLSRTIESNKNAYYDALQAAQKSNEITLWIEYFIDVILRAQRQAEEQISFTLQKTRFFDTYTEKINDRQRLVLQRMLENGPDSFEGGMSTKKYIKITKTSKPTATRDLLDLLKKGAVTASGEGRGRRYHVKL
ncbi:MAG: Fic family protein [Rhodospirillales bacterium]|nr:Fic family protein [Rhodospirillales bacterium]